MATPLDLSGRKFGRLTALYAIPGHRGQGRRWACLCDCGAEISTYTGNLMNGHQLSCGCYRAENGGLSSITHHMTNSPEYYVWESMKARCTNPKTMSYKRYGGRGITVCAEWTQSFEAFFRDLGPRPSALHSLERINNDGPYAPDNCRWATMSEQALNRGHGQRSRLLTHKGETLSVGEWARRLGLSRGVVQARLRLGWSVERIVETPLQAR